MALNCSTITASNLLKQNIVQVIQTTISNFKKNEIIIDKSLVTSVCIDDFALKKRHKYGTIMIDIMAHKIIDIIESRDLNDVIVWLSSFPNLQIFSRDGSPTYRNAITSTHPTNLQVNDRFHIFKNLTDYA